MKEGYKMTKIGLVPEDWEVVKLGEVLETNRLGGNYKNSSDFSGLPLIKMGNIGRGNIILNKLEYTEKKLSYHEEDILSYGDLLFNTRNTLDLVGKTAVWRSELSKALFNSNLLRLDFSKNKIASSFFMNYMLNSRATLKKLRRVATGTTSVAAIYTKDILNIRLALPPLPEQQKIANILSLTDEKIEVIEQKISEAESLKKGLMQRLLTRGIGHTEFKETVLGEVPVSWEVVKQSEVAVFNNGRAYKRTEWEEEGVPVIRLQNLTGTGNTYYYSNIKLPDRQYCNYGDLLYMWSATLGPVIWKGGKAIYHYHIWRIDQIDNKIDKVYHYFLLDDVTTRMKSQSHGSTMLHITKGGMEKLKIALPPLPEQQKIAEILSTADEKIEVLREKSAAYRELKRGLMQQLLTGRIRVRV